MRRIWAVAIKGGQDEHGQAYQASALEGLARLLPGQSVRDRRPAERHAAVARPDDRMPDVGTVESAEVVGDHVLCRVRLIDHALVRGAAPRVVADVEPLMCWDDEATAVAGIVRSAGLVLTDQPLASPGAVLGRTLPVLWLLARSWHRSPIGLAFRWLAARWSSWRASRRRRRENDNEQTIRVLRNANRFLCDANAELRERLDAGYPLAPAPAFTAPVPTPTTPTTCTSSIDLSEIRVGDLLEVTGSARGATEHGVLGGRVVEVGVGFGGLGFVLRDHAGREERWYPESVERPPVTEGAWVRSGLDHDDNRRWRVARDERGLYTCACINAAGELITGDACADNRSPASVDNWIPVDLAHE